MRVHPPRWITADELPGYAAGIGKNDRPEEFTFTATQAGQYAVVCGVPGHAQAGMWDEFDVVAGLAAPQVFVQG